MSGVAFNAMWTAPPPPSYTDTVSVDPTDYAVLTTSRGDEAVVHKGCLAESPVLLFCFRKRVPLNTEEVTVEFVAPPDATTTAENVGSATSFFTHRHLSLRLAEGDLPTGVSSSVPVDGRDAANAAGDDLRHLVAADVSNSAVKSNHVPRRPVMLTESLCTDNTVKIVFPRLNRAQLEVVVAYLYYKHRYNRRPAEARPRFDVPPSAALEVMRVAKTLQC